MGQVSVELVPPEDRSPDVTSPHIVYECRERIGTIPDAKEFNFRAKIGRGGEPTNPPLLSPARSPPAWEAVDQTPVFDPLAPAPEPAFGEFDQTVTW